MDNIFKKALNEVIDESNKQMENVLGETSTLSSRTQYYNNKLSRVTTLKEDVMKRYFNMNNNRCKPILVEKITLDRIMNKHGKNGYICISACRSDMSAEENEKRSAELRHEIEDKGYSYLPSYGGYRNPKTGEEGDYEVSFTVFNYDRNGQSRDFESLFDNAIYWCKKYEQDDVMVKAPNDVAKYYTSDGTPDSNFSSNDKIFKNDSSKEFFTSLKDKESSEKEVEDKLWRIFKKETASNGQKPQRSEFEKWKTEPWETPDGEVKTNAQKVGNIGRRWTNDIEWIGECYANPTPTTYTEHIARVSRGEIMIFS